MTTPIDDARIVSLSAVTLATHDMARAVGFYQALGFRIVHGGANEAFTSFALGDSYLNITSETHGPISWWGRIIFYVSDVDAFYRKVKALGIEPQFAPRDAPWNERYFHLTDPDGHELSFARPL
ncbi:MULTISPECIES: VOC family protein [unclassified Caballeronia]|jgi:catechol 2,3-dioxygenase-like lactoylglutathione lyase family enzyme|uniref:VOC family protein n=1 Tax=unclassified Caballeronia TaxID=2646786 RepID=UPI00158A9B50|nr:MULTISPECIES: VOC family protein [unclassified Caballeronia]QSN63218.1 VOC family protein [Caballeronia sp. M1242]